MRELTVACLLSSPVILKKKVFLVDEEANGLMFKLVLVMMILILQECSKYDNDRDDGDNGNTDGHGDNKD